MDVLVRFRPDLGLGVSVLRYIALQTTPVNCLDSVCLAQYGVRGTSHSRRLALRLL